MAEEMHAKKSRRQHLHQAHAARLDISKELCASLAAHRPPRSRSWPHHRMDMEGSVYTDVTLEIFESLCSANTAIPDSPSRPICIAQKRFAALAPLKPKNSSGQGAYREPQKSPCKQPAGRCQLQTPDYAADGGPGRNFSRPIASHDPFMVAHAQSEVPA